MVYHQLIFVFVFLPVYLIGSLLLREPQAKNLLSAGLSLVFLVWGRPVYFALIIINIFLAYLAGRLQDSKTGKRLRLAAAVLNTLSVLPGAFYLAAKNDLSGGIAAVGLMGFALRQALYLLYTKRPEKSPLRLTVYLISFEFMCVSPVLGYDQLRDELVIRRRPGLAELKAGLTRFIFGLGAAGVIGLGLDRLRLLALHTQPVPWMDGVFGLLIGFIEIYAAAIAYISMSEGLCLMSGYRIRCWDSCFMPRPRMKNHLGYIWLTASAQLSRLFCGMSGYKLAGLCAVMCIIIGAAHGLGAGAVGLLACILLAMLLEELFELKGTPAGFITYLLLIAGLTLCTVCGSEGLSGLFSSLAPGSYDFDISYLFDSELSRLYPIIILGIIYCSPLKPMLSRLARRLGSRSPGYPIIRLLTAAALCAVIIVYLAAYSSFAVSGGAAL